jgi:hypothetical protein
MKAHRDFVARPRHHFDYDDRSFTQHFVELGVEASF